MSKNNIQINKIHTKAENFIKQKQFNEVIELLNPLEKNLDTKCMQILAQAYAQNNQIEDCDRVYQDAIRKDSSNGRLMINYAKTCIEMQRYEQAEKVCLDAIEKNIRDQKDIKIILVKAYQGQDKLEELLKLSGELISKYPDDVKLKENLSKFNIKQKKSEQKREISKKTVESKKIYSKGMLEYHNDNYQVAIDCFEEFLKDEKGDARTLKYLAKAYFKNKEIKKAEGMMTQALRIDKDNENNTLYELGKIYLEERRFEEAEFVLKKSIRLGMGERNLDKEYISLGNLYTDQEKYDEAEKIFKKAIAENETNLDAKIYMSMMYAKEGNDEKAKKIYETMIKEKGEKKYDPKKRKKHILKHTKDDKTKPYHGVFNIDPIEVLRNIDFTKEKKSPGYLCDIYCIRYENCGYEGGQQGTNKQLNHITIITKPYSKDVITMYPSNEIKFDCKVVEEKSDIETLKQLVKEQEQLKDKEMSLNVQIHRREMEIDER